MLTLTQAHMSLAHLSLLRLTDQDTLLLNLLKNMEDKVAMDSEDDSITNPVVGVHSTDVVTEVKEDVGGIRDLVVQNENSCTEADGIIEVEEVHVQSLQLRAPAEDVVRWR